MPSSSSSAAAATAVASSSAAPPCGGGAAKDQPGFGCARSVEAHQAPPGQGGSAAPSMLSSQRRGAGTASAASSGSGGSREERGDRARGRAAPPPTAAAGAGALGSSASLGGGAAAAAGAGGAGADFPGCGGAGVSGAQALAEHEAAAAAGGGAGGGAAAASASAVTTQVPMNNYAFFVKYTYSNECALLAYNFHEIVTQLGIFDIFTYRHDHRLVSVTLAYIFYRYQVHHCDMALDLAVTLVYLEDIRSNVQPELLEQSKDAFSLICYLAFLAHAFNADRTIRLSDWYKEIGWRSFKNCQQLNCYVFFLFSKVRRFRLRVSETRVKRYIQRLCSVPSQIHSEAADPAAGERR